MSRSKVYFLSDLHLGARYFKDARQRERHIVRFLDSIKDDAREIFLLGDILDYWYEYRFVVPKGFTRFFGKIAELTDSGVKITWIVGNHDIWIFDYLPEELGVKVIDGNLRRKIDGVEFFMAHGDGAGADSLSFRFMRALFRNKFCQKLFSGINPRWTIPFALNWSNSSRKADAAYTDAGISGEALERLRKFALEQLHEHPDIRYFLFGHLHVVVRERITPKAEMLVTGDWISHFSYAVFDGKELHVATFPYSGD